MEKALYVITGIDVDYIVTCENEDIARSEFTTLFNQTIVNIKKLPLEDTDACKDFI